MRITRLFIAQALFPDATLSLTGTAAHYLIHVLRFKVGAAFHLFNERDGEWVATILKIHKKQVDVHLHQRTRSPDPPSRALYLFFALLKPNRLEMLLEKTTEAGVTHLVPCHTQYTQTRPFNPQRLTNIIIEATEQCGRLTPPLLLPSAPLETQLKSWPSSAPLFFGDVESTQSFWNVLEDLRCRKSPSQVGLLIGPEGGWSEAEKTFLRTLSCAQAISLGPHTLRAETAAIIGTGLLQNALQDLEKPL